MLYHFLTQYADTLSALNLFNYLTFRTGGAIMTSLIITLCGGPSIIRWLKSKQGEGQPIREIGPDHLVKKGTPTMGGLMILLAFIVSSMLWMRLDNPYAWIVIFVTLGFGAVGFLDDYLKLTKRSHKGVSGKFKLIALGLISFIAAYAVTQITPAPLATGLAFPFIKNYLFPMGYFYIPFAMLVMVGTSNAVNLTDGLDGLAIVPVMIALACFGLITYLVSNAVFAEYLQLEFVKGSGEIAVLCGALIGAGLGFLWYNAPPAMVFMGDTGSLSMGGALGAMSIISKHEIVLAIIGGLFVLETVSVIVQVTSFKLTGKRVFRMAPLHHHFEQKGWSEPTIVIRFWIIAIILALIGLSTLKLR